MATSSLVTHLGSQTSKTWYPHRPFVRIGIGGGGRGGSSWCEPSSSHLKKALLRTALALAWKEQVVGGVRAMAGGGRCRRQKKIRNSSLFAVDFGGCRGWMGMRSLGSSNSTTERFADVVGRSIRRLSIHRNSLWGSVGRWGRRRGVRVGHCWWFSKLFGGASSSSGDEAWAGVYPVCIMYHKFERPQKPAIFYVKLKMSVQRT